MDKSLVGKRIHQECQLSIKRKLNYFSKIKSEQDFTSSDFELFD